MVAAAARSRAKGSVFRNGGYGVSGLLSAFTVARQVTAFRSSLPARAMKPYSASQLQ